MGPKSKKGILVVYDDFTNGYRVWYTETEKIETHRDTVFVKDTELLNNKNTKI